MIWSLLAGEIEAEVADSATDRLVAKVGMDIARTGLSPRTNSLNLVMTRRRVATNDDLTLIKPATISLPPIVVCTAAVRDISTTVDRNLNEVRYQVRAEGIISRLVAFGGGLRIAPVRGVTAIGAIEMILDAVGVDPADRVLLSYQDPDTRVLEAWWLDPSSPVWSAILTLARTMGPRWRAYEDQLGRFVVGIPGSRISANVYSGRAVAGPSDVIISRFEDDNAGIDRVVNDVSVDYRELQVLAPPAIVFGVAGSTLQPTGNAFVTYSEATMRAIGVENDDVVIVFYAMASLNLTAFAFPDPTDWTDLGNTTLGVVAGQPGAEAALMQAGAVWSRGPADVGIETRGSWSLAHMSVIVLRGAADPIKARALGDSVPAGQQTYPIPPLGAVDDGSVILTAAMGVQTITTTSNPPVTSAVSVTPSVTSDGVTLTAEAFATNQQLQSRYLVQDGQGEVTDADIWSIGGAGAFTGVGLARMAVEVPLRRTVGWQADGAVTVPADGRVDVEATVRGLFASPALPTVERGDYTVSAGSAVVSFGPASRGGFPVIRIDAGAAGATIADLRLRVVEFVDTGALTVNRSNQQSIDAYGPQGPSGSVWGFLSEAEAADLAEEIIAYSAFPRRSWTIVVDEPRTDRFLAVDPPLQEQLRVHLDSDFEELGSVVGLEHTISGPAGLRQTRIKMLAVEAGAPSRNRIYLGSTANPIYFGSTANPIYVR